MATTLSQHVPPSFFARPAEVVAPELIGCLLVKRQEGGELLWGVIVETEAYSQAEPACHGHRRRTPSNDTLFGEPGRFYVYVSYGIHHCVNVVTHKAGWANGVLLRAVQLPGEPERVAAGPGLLARYFSLDRRDDRRLAAIDQGLWIAPRPPALQRWWQEEEARASLPLLVQTVRIGIREARDLPWRWDLRASRSVSRRASGDRPPRPAEALDSLWPDSWRLLP
ncbi:MAG: DNA-3-methyladenine glycosylase [Cyanobacteriota bacterium]